METQPEPTQPEPTQEPTEDGEQQEEGEHAEAPRVVERSASVRLEIGDN